MIQRSKNGNNCEYCEVNPHASTHPSRIDLRGSQLFACAVEQRPIAMQQRIDQPRRRASQQSTANEVAQEVHPQIHATIALDKCPQENGYAHPPIPENE